MQLVKFPKKMISVTPMGVYKCFVLYNGKRTQTFYDCAKFDEYIGSYPILDKDNEVVEYMDLIGNFTKQPTEFAKDLYDYISGRDVAVVRYYMYIKTYYTSLTEFPAKYLLNSQVREIVEDEEKYKSKNLNKSVKGLIPRLKCKLYLNKTLNKKLKRAKEYIKDAETLAEENHFNL